MLTLNDLWRLSGAQVAGFAGKQAPEAMSAMPQEPAAQCATQHTQKSLRRVLAFALANVERLAAHANHSRHAFDLQSKS